MTHNDAALELENPPEIISFYSRFADACAMGAMALRRDGNRGSGDLAALYKAHLDRIFDACGAGSVEEVIEKLNGGKP